MPEESIKNKNIARGRSIVGVQAGVVNGDISVGAASGRNLQDQVADLREALLAARESNELDSETFAAAEEELSKVAGHLVGPVDVERGKVVVALKRLKGLVEGVANLAGKVAVIITAVQGLR